MRKILLLLSLVLLLSIGSPSVYAGGGPDVYGYIWLDSNDPGGPVYNWTDITQLPSATQVLGLADDNAVGPYSIGFDFHYYWSDYNEVKIGSNGWVSFKTTVGNVAHCFPTVPSPGGNADNFLAPFMTDLNFNGSLNPGQVWYWTNVAADTFIVQYETCPWWVNAVPDYTAGTNTFQLILTTVDSSITFQYNTMAPTFFNDTPGCASDCEIGIENVTGNIGLEVLNETIPTDNYAVKFFYPQVVTFQIFDVAPNWNGNSDNAGQFVLLGNSVTFVSDIKNTGNVDMNDPTNVTCKIKPLALVPITYQSSTTIDTIQLNSSKLATFSPPFTFSTAGQYYFETETANGSDINPSNNLNTVEVSVVEADPMGNIGFTYCTNNPPDGGMAWSGGNWNDGGGVYMVPPQYPVTLHTVDMWINQGANNPANNSSFLIMIIDDDGPNGTPGTVLVADTVMQGTYTPAAWVSTALSSPAVINSGGFYVGWFMGGDSISLGTEQIGPISRRSYEILGGAWAEYRSNTSTDLLIIAHVTDSTLMTAETPIVTVPKTLRLKHYPNPTNGLTTISYELPTAGEAKIEIISLQGQRVFSKVYGPLPAGPHEFSYASSQLEPGLYFITAETDGKKVTSKMVVTR